MKKFVGITIGPIVKTLNSASSTLQLWGTSYISELITKKLPNEWKQ